MIYQGLQTLFFREERDRPNNSKSNDTLECVTTRTKSFHFKSALEEKEDLKNIAVARNCVKFPLQMKTKQKKAPQRANEPIFD